MEPIKEVLVDFQKTRDFVDGKLQVYLANENPLLQILHDSITYSLFSGGKRVRPLFCFIVGELFGVPRSRLVSLSCALEMIHTASLIMDDLPHMDDAKLRRGKPANHLVYGQDVAALASIGLLTRAYEIVLADLEVPDDKKVRVVHELAKAVGTNGLVGGQFVDLRCAGESADPATLEYVHDHKTASLFVASGVTAAIVGGGSAREIAALEEYARNMGFAFQILDDLLDATGTVKEVGKSLQKDKRNFVDLYGLEGCRNLVQDYTGRAIKAIEVFNGRQEKLIALAEILLKRKS